MFWPSDTPQTMLLPQQGAFVRSTDPGTCHTPQTMFCDQASVSPAIVVRRRGLGDNPGAAERRVGVDGLRQLDGAGGVESAAALR